MTILPALAIVAALLPPPPGEPESGSPYLPRMYLVRATVLDIWKQDKKAIHEKAHLRITKVVAGPEKLLGKDFFCFVGNPKPWVSGYGPGVEYPLDGVVEYLDKGVDGLWWVYEDTSFLTVVPELRWEKVEHYRLHQFPYSETKELGRIFHPRIGEFSSFEEFQSQIRELRREDAAAWSDAASCLFRARTDTERRAILVLYASAPESLVSGWAITLLAQGPKQPAIKFLRSLTANLQISVDAQFTVDRELCRIDKSWRGSAARLGVIRRWLAVDSTPGLFRRGCNALEAAIDSGEIDVPQFAKLFFHALREYEQMSEIQKGTLSQILWTVRFRAEDRGPGEEFLRELVKNSKHQLVRVKAEAGLKQFERPGK